MFCDGICKKRNKKCGLLVDVVMSNELTQNTKVMEKCALIGLYESMIRQEQGQIRIQAAVESGRNEQSKGMKSQTETLASGFLGLIHMVKEQNEEAEKKIKYVENTLLEEDTETIEGEVEDGTV